MWPRPRPNFVPSGILIHPAIRPHQTWAEISEGGLSPLGVALGPHLTQCCPGRGLPSYQLASWATQPFSHNKNGPKLGLCPFFEEAELGPHLAQCGMGGRLPPYQVASWSIQLFGHNGRAENWGLCPLGEGELGAHLTQCGQGRGLPTCQVSSWFVQPFGHNTPTLQTGQTDNGPFINGRPKTEV